jgi:ubiquinone biosynthesis protein Coq4
LLKSIEQGWQMGSHAKPLFAQKWEEEWEKPVSQWQAELQIQPILST